NGAPQQREQHGGEQEAKAERPQAASPAPQQAKRERPRTAEQQPPRDKPQRTAQRPRAADSWTDEPKAPQRRGPAPERSPAAEPVRKPQPAPRHDERVGFAENIPAFMRKPSRPAKVPGRG
ncbi:MAG: DEAD/DEAH box helicase, partial [Hyphomicrobium denitrificans]|nr:DEAD/DEAH box helicase [Hyphomicrobium denitrificans]